MTMGALDNAGPDRRVTSPFRPQRTSVPVVGYSSEPEPEVRMYPGPVRALILLGVIAGGGVFWWGLYSLILAGLQRVFG